MNDQESELIILNQAKISLEQELLELRQKNAQMEKEADELWINIQTKQSEFEILEKAIKNFIQRSQIDIANLKTQLKRTHTNHKKVATNVRQSTKGNEGDQKLTQLVDNFRLLQRDTEILINIITSLGQNNKLPDNTPPINNDFVRESLENIEVKLENYEKLKSDFEMLAYLFWRSNSTLHRTKMNTKEDEHTQAIESNNKLEGNPKSSGCEQKETIDQCVATNGPIVDK